MPYPIENKLVVGITSTALFDFSLEHHIYEQEGVAAFQRYQAANRDKIPEPGTAFPFIKRLLNLNRIFPEESPVEVVILSRNDPQAGLRMMDAMPHYGLDITRAFFLSGADPYPYMKAVNACQRARSLVDEPAKPKSERHRHCGTPACDQPRQPRTNDHCCDHQRRLGRIGQPFGPLRRSTESRLQSEGHGNIARQRAQHC